MATSHLKRLNAPKTWKVQRRVLTFITRPNPGAHVMALCMPINLVLRDMLSHATSTKEVRTILISKEVLVDSNVISDKKYQLGLFDTLELPKLSESYRMLLDEKGYLALLKIDKKETHIKPCKVLNKSAIKGGKTQLNLDGGINVIVEKDTYKTGDSVMLDLPSKNILEHIKLEKGVYIFLNGGKHVGDHGVVEDIKQDSLSYKSRDGSVIETLKKYAIIIGKDKPAISLFK
jgi:small subunit ribosomal protein S4e